MLSIHRQTEEDLVAQSIKGDGKAQKALFDRYSPRMLGVCIRYLKDEYTAEDIMITGFMKVFEKLYQFKFEGSLEGWIRRTMINESLTYLRKNKQVFSDVDMEIVSGASSYGNAESALEQEDLLKMVAGLPIGYRTVFNLYAIEGFSHKEIAEKLGINENTSKSQLSRARALLKDLLMKSGVPLKQQITSS